MLKVVMPWLENKKPQNYTSVYEAFEKEYKKALDSYTDAKTKAKAAQKDSTLKEIIQAEKMLKTNYKILEDK